MRINLRRRNGPQSVLMTDRSRKDLNGRTLEQIAAARGVEPVVAALDIVLSGDASIASFNMHEDDIVRLMRQEFVFTGSDGSDGHPRKYGTYPLKLRDYVLGKGVMSLETFVRRSSADVAESSGIAQRGRLAEGYFADIIVFDPAKVRERSTYAEPTRLAEGISWVFVNGQLAVDNGRITGALAGRGIARGR
jgi:N-acyl-D-aspartate/D-glutamate deacylase